MMFNMVDGNRLLAQLEKHTKKCHALQDTGTEILCPKCGMRIYREGEGPVIDTKGVTIESY